MYYATQVIINYERLLENNTIISILQKSDGRV
jgi:hypothetical protein